MKRIVLTLVSIILLTGTVFAQAPKGFNYQAVVRNSAGQLMANRMVSVRISILQGSANGTTVYQQTESVNTNGNGLFTLVVGDNIADGQSEESAHQIGYQIDDRAGVHVIEEDRRDKEDRRDQTEPKIAFFIDRIMRTAAARRQRQDTDQHQIGDKGNPQQQQRRQQQKYNADDDDIRQKRLQLFFDFRFHKNSPDKLVSVFVSHLL